MAFYAYLLKCSDGSYYAGHTDNLEQRVAQHNHGEIPGYTHNKRPVRLVWSENFMDREQALAAERQIKGWSRAKKEALIAGDFDLLKLLARKKQALRYESSSSSMATQNERAEADDSAPPPIIVLVRPQLGENIGKAARAMLNFGLTEMRIVSPRDGWPNPDAVPSASGADSVLDNAKVFETVAEATADCGQVFATTVRKRGIPKPVVSPADMSDAIRSAASRCAILFGPERSGLDADDIALARAIVTVPVNPDFSSLNLAQAVILLAYEWSKGENLAVPTETDEEHAVPAPQSDLENLVIHLEKALEPTGYFFPPDREPVTKRTLRSILTKPGWTTPEVRALRGVISALEKKR